MFRDTHGITSRSIYSKLIILYCLGKIYFHWIGLSVRWFRREQDNPSWFEFFGLMWWALWLLGAICKLLGIEIKNCTVAEVKRELRWPRETINLFNSFEMTLLCCDIDQVFLDSSFLIQLSFFLRQMWDKMKISRRRGRRPQNWAQKRSAIIQSCPELPRNNSSFLWKITCIYNDNAPWSVN